MSSFIPLSVPNLKGNEQKYINEVIANEWVSSSGAMINQFEREFSKYLNVIDATTCQSGTAGLHLAMILANVERNDEVIVPSLTFIAAVNPVRYVGAEPVFMDCDDSLCIDIDKLEAFCYEECTFDGEKLYNKFSGKHIKAIIIVHVFGNMADMERLMLIAKNYNLIVIEDATEALGTYYAEGFYESKYAGTIGDIGVYSFNGNKIITTGGGGMLVAKDSAITKKAKYLSTQAKDDEVNFIHNEVGYNYRMTNIQAALGMAQLEQLESFIEVKRRNYELYKKEVDYVKGVSLLPFKKNIRTNHWFYSLYLNGFTLTRDELIRHFNANHIQTRPIWGLIHQQKPYQNCFAYKIEKAVDFHHKIVNIPCSTNLTEGDIQRVMQCLKGI